MDFQEQLRLLNKRKAELFGEKAVTPEGTARLYGALFDEGTFVELNALAAQGGCVTGYGLVDDLPAYLIAQDDQVDGGAMSQAQAKRITNAIDKAMAVAAPVVLVINSQGAKVTEGAAVLHAYTEVFTRLQMMDGLSPRIAVINGPCVGVAAHFAALCDISIAVEGKAQLLSAPTSVLEAVHGAAKDSKTWGSASVLAQQGAVALAASDTAAALKTVRELLLLLPSSVYSEPVRDAKDDMNRLLNDSAMENGLKLAKMVADKHSLMELYPTYGAGAHVALARLDGEPCGIVSTEFTVDEGRLDAASCDKIARFVTLCQSFELPVITLINSKGLAVPKPQDQAWLMRASTDMMRAYHDAVHTRLAVIAGDAIGTAYAAFGGKWMADTVFAWPASVIAPLSKEVAVQTFDADALKTKDRSELEAAYAASADGFAAAALGIVDEVIDPAQTRKYLISALQMHLTA